MGCSINGNGQQSPHLIDGQPSGLLCNHSYSIEDLIEFKDKTNPGQKIRLLRLRNPWGKSEWIKAWGAGSDEEKLYRAEIEAYIKTLHEEEQFDIDDDDGTFLMNFDNWSENFTNLFINIDFPEDWTGIRFLSAWTKSNSGGIPHKTDQALFNDFARNPQFLLKPIKDTEVIFSLT
jgi:hypothetical protein